mgnify:CR=1 FL=1
MPKHGKNFEKASEGFDKTERYAVNEAVTLAITNSFAKFDETVDVAINLGVDPKYSDQMVRGACPLPNGRTKRLKPARLAPTSAAETTWSRRSRAAGWTSTTPSPPRT